MSLAQAVKNIKNKQYIAASQKYLAVKNSVCEKFFPKNNINGVIASKEINKKICLDECIFIILKYTNKVFVRIHLYQKYFQFYHI